MNSPLYDAIRKYSEEVILPFHMPGHKMGKGILEEFKKAAFNLDVTEVPGTDNLHFPEGSIKEAEEVAAKAFGSDRTYFLVNGSTCGIYAMVLAVCNPGDKLIVARDSHKALTGALILGDINPVYVVPEIVEDFNISGGINIEELEKVMKANRDAKAVFLTYPNYYGICSDLLSIAKLTDKYGMKLIVDEAHGAHFNFNRELPPTAISLGADMCVQSAHKTLPALTQSSYLHVSNKFKDFGRLEGMLRLMQTTSPSYLLMISLDLARAYMEDYGEIELARIINKCKNIKEMLKYKYINTLGKELCGKYGIHDLDQTKLVFNFNAYDVSGYQIEKILRMDYRIQLEMSDIYNAVAICTTSDDDEALELLGEAIAKITDGLKKGVATKNYIDGASVAGEYRILPERVMNPRAAEFETHEYVPLQKGAGRISKSVIAPYPPGIPLICPGEIINQATINAVGRIIKLGGHVNGIEDNMIKVVKN